MTLFDQMKHLSNQYVTPSLQYQYGNEPNLLNKYIRLVCYSSLQYWYKQKKIINFWQFYRSRYFKWRNSILILSIKIRKCNYIFKQTDTKQ